MKQILALLILGWGLLAVPSVAAQSETTARLIITPTVCVLDVVQDGSNQTLQPSPGCETALPNLLPGPGQLTAVPLFDLPFAGAQQNNPPLIQPREGAAWTPIVSKQQVGPTTQTTSRFTYVASGFAMAAIASAVGIDIALFELHHSRSIVRWMHRQSLGRILKG
jgi:hypothetical protein